MAAKSFSGRKTPRERNEKVASKHLPNTSPEFVTNIVALQYNIDGQPKYFFPDKDRVRTLGTDGFLVILPLYSGTVPQR